MIRINLLPEELRKSERARQVRTDITKVIAVAAAVVAIAIALSCYWVGRRMSALSRIKTRLNSLSAQAEEAEGLIKQKQQLVKEFDLLEGFASRRILWHELLNEVGDALPDGLFLTKLTCNAREQSALVLKGETMTGYGIERVVEFIDALRRSPSFVRIFPDLTYSIESMEKGRKSFEIRCTQRKK